MFAPVRRALLLVTLGALSIGARQASGAEGVALAPSDKAVADAARTRALETGLSRAAVSWTGTTPGTRGSVTPLRTYLARNGMMCREFEEATQVPNTGTVTNHLACRDNAGIWHIVR